SMGSPPGTRCASLLRLRMPRKRPQVLGGDLNRSESRRGRRQLLLCFPTLKHSTRGIGGGGLPSGGSIRPLSALGLKQTLPLAPAMSAFPPKADIGLTPPPALGEWRHRGLTRLRVAVRRDALLTGQRWASLSASTLVRPARFLRKRGRLQVRIQHRTRPRYSGSHRFGCPKRGLQAGKTMR